MKTSLVIILSFLPYTSFAITQDEKQKSYCKAYLNELSSIVESLKNTYGQSQQTHDGFAFYSTKIKIFDKFQRIYTNLENQCLPHINAFTQLQSSLYNSTPFSAYKGESASGNISIETTIYGSPFSYFYIYRHIQVITIKPLMNSKTLAIHLSNAQTDSQKETIQTWFNQNSTLHVKTEHTVYMRSSHLLYFNEAIQQLRTLINSDK